MAKISRRKSPGNLTPSIFAYEKMKWKTIRAGKRGEKEQICTPIHDAVSLEKKGGMTGGDPGNLAAVMEAVLHAEEEEGKGGQSLQPVTYRKTTVVV